MSPATEEFGVSCRAAVNLGSYNVLFASSLRLPDLVPGEFGGREIELSRNPVVLLDLRIFARRDDSAREPSKPGGKANARELKADG